MTLDAILASAHHLAAFALVALLVVEAVLVRDALDARTLRRLGPVDALYGLTAAFVVVAGIGRLLFGVVPADVYLTNLFFWTKMGALALVAGLSIVPTIRFLAWGRAARRDATFVVPPAAAAPVRRLIAIELALLPVVPISAALMARGFGAL